MCVPIVQEGPDHDQHGDEAAPGLFPPSTFDQPADLEGIVDERLHMLTVVFADLEPILLFPWKLPVGDEDFEGDDNNIVVRCVLFAAAWLDLA